MSDFFKEINRIYSSLETNINPKKEIRKLKTNLKHSDKEASLQDTIQILFLNKFCDEMEYTNKDTIEYFSNITSKYAVNVLRFPDNHDFVYYKVDQIIGKPGSPEEIFNIELGDLYFMNASLMQNYHKNKRKPIGLSYFEENAKRTYEEVIRKAYFKEVQDFFIDVLLDFEILKTGISEVAQENIFN